MIHRIDRDRAHGERGHEVGLGLPGGAAIHGFPDTAVVGGNVNDKIRGAGRVDGNVDHFAGVGAGSLEVLFGVDAQWLGADQLPAHASENHGSRCAGRRRPSLPSYHLHALQLLNAAIPDFRTVDVVLVRAVHQVLLPPLS